MGYLISAFLSLILTILETLFFGSFLPRKQTKTPLWFVIILFSILSTIYINILGQWPWTKNVANIVSAIVMAKILYTTTIIRGAFFSILFFAISSLIDIATSAILLNVSERTIESLLSGHISFLLGAGISYMAMLIVVLVIKKVSAYQKRTTALSYKEFLRLLIFLVVSAFVLVSMFNEAVLESQVSPLAFVSVIGLLAANIVMVYIMDKLDQEQKSREENRILQHQISLEMNTVTALMEYNETQARIAHDHTNHLNVIHSLLDNGEVIEAQHYIAKLNGMRKLTQYVIHTNNPVADAILNLKILLAKKNNIQVSIDVNDLSEFPLQSEELATVLTNVLDNAIEACADVNNKPEIKIRLIYDHDESLMSVRNTTARPVEIKDNMVNTTRTYSELHGFGLKNVATVLAKYDYDYAIGYEDGWFQFTAIL